jgi:hypothetical protein
MNWTSYLTSILVSFGASAAAIGALAWLARELVGKFIASDSEKFKAGLAQDLEKFKADLRRTAYEHEVRFKRLQEKQAEIIAEFYKRMVIADAFLISLESNRNDFMKGKHKGQNEAGKQIVDASMYFVQNEVWFSEELCRLVHKWCEEAFQHAYLYDMFNQGMAEFWKTDIEPMVGAPAFDEWATRTFDTWKQSRADIPAILTKLKEQLRGLLGAI